MKTCPKQTQREKIHVALFCGGRGSSTIIQELLRWPHIQLTLIVNAYDDGLSTGALRDFIAHMLGPSDFRKNLSYLLDPYSPGQYALKQLLELRFPASVDKEQLLNLQEFTQKKKLNLLSEPFYSLFGQIDQALLHRLCVLLRIFFDYANNTELSFDYKDCSLGNLIFAGAFLEKKYDFNAAACEISDLVSSRASVVNVSCGENRILVALKEDGQLLARESEIVGPQSSVPIKELFLISKNIDLSLWQNLEGKSVEDKIHWLQSQESLPAISPEAQDVLESADIILFGPGTQHSSLFPSYKIAEDALRQASALKIMVMNLGPDQDITSLSTQDIVDRALKYMGDGENQHRVIMHLLINQSFTKLQDSLLGKNDYKNIIIKRSQFGNPFKADVHNGRAVVDAVFGLWRQSKVTDTKPLAMSIFVDIHRGSLALHDVYEELLEVEWQEGVGPIHLTINQANTDNLLAQELIQIKTARYTGHFPEMNYFADWLQHEHSEYLILLTGDGRYCFRDVILGLNLLEQGNFGAVFGSRNQSRRQFQNSLRAAYGEKKVLAKLSFMGSLVLSAIFALRFGMISSDPLTGFRIFKRSRLGLVIQRLKENKLTTPAELTTCLLKHHIEIAELPVAYRTFAGFVDPKWRIQRGLRNLFSTLRRSLS